MASPTTDELPWRAASDERSHPRPRRRRPPGGARGGLSLAGGAGSPPREATGRLLRLDLAADARREVHVLALGVQRMAGLLLASGLAPAQREQAETLRTLADSLLAVVDEALDPSRAAGAAPSPPSPP